MTMWASLGSCFKHAWPQPLAAHFHEPKARNATNLDARAICFQPILHTFFDRRIIAPFIHVDEVNNDQASKVSEPKLTCHLIGCL